jgi:hypothetical protein
MRPDASRASCGWLLVAFVLLAAAGKAVAQPLDSASPGITSINPAANGSDSTAISAGPFSDDVTVLTVGQRAVRWSEFRFWLVYLGRYYKTAHALSTIENWHVQQNGAALRDWFLSAATGYVCNDTAIEEQAAAAGIQLTPEDLAEQARIRADNIRIYGSYSEYLRIVAAMYGSEAQFQYLAKIDRLSAYLFARLYGSGGEQCSDECVGNYIESQGLAAVLYIFRARSDTVTHKLATPQRRRSDYRLLQRLHAQLQASEAPTALFPKLMSLYSDDKSLADYPEGRILARDAKGPEFDAAIRSLSDNAYSDVINAPDGYYLILRKPLSATTAVDTSGMTLRYWAAYESLFKAQIGSWCADLPIKYTDSYQHIDVEGLLR